MGESKLCHCGKPLHYGNPAVREFVEHQVAKLGECVRVTRRGRCWLVPRHYIALHGLKAQELPTLGFEEVPVEAES